MTTTEQLAEAIAITESRQSQLDLDNKRLNLDHSIVLHRDAASANDVKAMIAHLEAAGMPGDATLKVDGSDGHTRMYARWHAPLSSNAHAHTPRRSHVIEADLPGDED